MPSTFVPVGKVAASVVIHLDARRQLTRALKGSIEIETRNAEERARRADAENREYEIARGKKLIMEGLRLIQTYDSPQAAIDYLKSTLAAISGKCSND